jgi:hypothetical protein
MFTRRFESRSASTIGRTPNTLGLPSARPWPATSGGRKGRKPRSGLYSGANELPVVVAHRAHDYFIALMWRPIR